ncbi:MAG: hypothetical protein N2485_08500, partial [bacterium]|nr:hypothetical protein [bacterium]
MKNKYFFEGLAFVAPNSYFIYNKFLNKAIKGKLYSKFNKIKNMNYILNLLPESFYKKYYRMYGFGDNTIVKFAGLFDPPKKILCPNIFSLTNALYPHVREQILNLVYKLVPKEYIKGVLLIGTSVGYQWSDDSDIDVNILVYPHDIITEELNLKRHQLNSLNNYLVGTKHIINLYVSPWVKEQNWQDNPFGVYD